MAGTDFGEEATRPLRVLTLDGGGAKGFYTLGVLTEIEAMIGKLLCERFDLIFGTSTGAIIAALLALGMKVEEVLDLYREHVPTVMRHTRRRERTAALKLLAEAVFKDVGFEQVKTGLGVVSAQWQTERPMIFKASASQAHGRSATFVPGFGVRLADAVRASCSAFPFFERTVVTTSKGEKVELIDGGYCANNPTLYAIADAVKALGRRHEDLRVVSVGVGVYPRPKPGFWMAMAERYIVSVELLQKTLEINTQSMDQLRQVLFDDVPTIRISDTFNKPELATDLLEHDLDKLDLLFQQGRKSFEPREKDLKDFLNDKDTR